MDTVIESIRAEANRINELSKRANDLWAEYDRCGGESEYRRGIAVAAETADDELEARRSAHIDSVRKAFRDLEAACNEYNWLANVDWLAKPPSGPVGIRGPLRSEDPIWYPSAQKIVWRSE